MEKWVPFEFETKTKTHIFMNANMFIMFTPPEIRSERCTICIVNKLNPNQGWRDIPILRTWASSIDDAIQKLKTATFEKSEWNDHRLGLRLVLKENDVRGFENPLVLYRMREEETIPQYLLCLERIQSEMRLHCADVSKR